MLAYAVKVTRTPHAMTVEDVDDMKDHGFDDTAVLDVCQVAAYYNYVNRLADGLGVELEHFWTPENMIISRSDFNMMHHARSSGPSKGPGDVPR